MSNNFLLIVLYAVGFIAIFYFMAIRPQQRQRRSHEQLVSSIKRGDKVVTAGGIHGTVKRTDEGFVMLEISKGVDIKIARRAIAEVLEQSSPEKPAKVEKAEPDEQAALPPADTSEQEGPAAEA